MNVWMEITKDKYELPVAIADTAEELAKIRKVKAETIRRAVFDAKIGFRKKSKYIKVKIEGD